MHCSNSDELVEKLKFNPFKLKFETLSLSVNALLNELQQMK